MRFILRRRHLKVVIVTLKSGQAFRGVLWQHDREAFVLRNAEVLTDGRTEPVVVDGELILLRAEVSYFQRP